MVRQTTTYDGIEISGFDDKVYLTLDEGEGSQYCGDLSSIFRAFVRVEHISSLKVKACKQKFGSLTEYSRSPDSVVTSFPSGDSLHETHEKLVGIVGNHASSVKEDEYWNGYRDGCGDTWQEVAWQKFDKTFEGSPELSVEIGKMLVDMGVAVCRRTNNCFPLGEWATPSGSYVATISRQEANKCANCGADLSENKTVLESPDSIRRGTKYKCECCEKTWRGITTG